MPLSYTVSDDGTFVQTKGFGEIGPEDVFEYNLKTSGDASIKPGFKELIDVSGIEKSSLTHESFQHVRELVQVDQKRNVEHRLALVVGKDSSFSNARYYQSLVDRGIEKVIVSYDIRTARLWLGLPETETK